VPATPEDRARAHLILDLMGRLGTRAMAVGARDLSAGVDFLLAEGRRSKVKLLSCNLRRGGKPVFEPFALVEAAGLKVAIIGVSAPGPIAPGAADVQAEGTLASVKDALGKLPKHDLTIVLAATGYADARQLGEQLTGQLDFVIQSGEFRGNQPPQRLEQATFLFASGQKGQTLGKVRYDPGAPGATGLIELSGNARDKQQLEFVNGQVKTLEDRMPLLVDKQLIIDVKNSLSSLRARQAELKKSVETVVPKGARTMRFEWVQLGSDVSDDPAFKAEVLKVEPTYAGAH
jgi:hypothetical protein